HEQHQEDEEEDLRHTGRGTGNATKTEHRCDQRDDEECNGPAQHGTPPLCWVNECQGKDRMSWRHHASPPAYLRYQRLSGSVASSMVSPASSSARSALSPASSTASSTFRP